MKRIISLLVVISCLLNTALVNTFAEELDEEQGQILDLIYQRELENAIISGTGTETDPYIVDYSLAPTFKEFISDNWNQKYYGTMPEENTAGINSTFAQYALTEYNGTSSTGGMWVYSSGGLSPYSDGNIRIQRVMYTPNGYLDALYTARSNGDFWASIVFDLGYDAVTYQSEVYNAVISACNQCGWSTVGGVTVANFSSYLCTSLGIVGLFAGFGTIVNNITLSVINNARTNGKNYLTFSFLTAYQGSWYADTSNEAGFQYNRIYIPNSIYGSGTFYPGN